MALNRWTYLSAAAMLLVGIGAQAQTPIFFTDRSAFDAAVGPSTLIDFEGIFGASEFGTPGASAGTLTVGPAVVDGVSFSAAPGTIGVAGPTSAVNGNPFNSALLFSTEDRAITADLSGVGTVFAVGAFFGDICGRAGASCDDISPSSTLLTLNLASGASFTETVTAGDMGLNNPGETFYGWTIAGDPIVSVTHSTFGTGSLFEGIDDFVFATAATVAEPSTLAVLGFGLAGLGLARRGRTIKRRDS